MRFLSYLSSILVLIFLVACGGGGGSAGTSAGTVAGTFSVSAPSALSLGVGSVSTYQISGGTAPYSIGSSDSRVVTATTSGAGLTINGLKSGTATLVILDAGGKSISITVSVDGTSAAGAPANVEILPSSVALSSATGSSVSFAVTVKDSSNSTIPNQTITFTATSGNLVGANPAPITGANGTNTSVTLSPGVDQSNRQITVTVTADRVSKAITIPVTGSKVTVSGPGSTLVGALAASYTVKATDSAGKAIRGAALKVTSSLGNRVFPADVTTDTSGAATIAYTPTNVGLDTLTVAGIGATGQTNVFISNEDFAFNVPTPNQEFDVSTTGTATVTYKISGVPQVGKSVFFSTTRGSIVAGPVTTDANGMASTTFSSPTTGPVTISAQSGNSRTTVTANFVSSIPFSLFLQANPNAILPNEKGSSSNQSSLIATVRDATGNPVVNQTVNFTALQDLSNGYISPVSANTDSSGIATSQFISGPLSTPANGVTLQASVHATSIANTATMTVNGSALFISIGLANVIDVIDKVTYGKTFSVYVTDANGAPAGNRAVTLSVFPTSYVKGSLSYCEDCKPPGWVIFNTFTRCANEDINRNGILNSGEDINQDGLLWPGIPVALSPTTLITDDKGYATYQATWGKNYSLWTTIDVTAKATVNGTESKKVLSYGLEALQADIESTATPPFRRSPFGIATTCTDPN